MSLCIILGTPTRLVAASDSRRWFTDGPPPPEGTRLRYADDSNKIAYRDRFIVAATGETDTLAPWRSLPSVTAESAAHYLDRLIAAVAAQPIVSRWPVVATIGVFGFGPLPDGGIVRVRCEPGGTLAVVARAQIDQFPVVAALGWEELPFAAINDRLQPQLVGTPGEAQMVAMVHSAIVDVARTTTLVGGAVHVFVLDATGGRWIAP
jgi:hypothetical protein